MKKIICRILFILTTTILFLSCVSTDMPEKTDIGIIDELHKEIRDIISNGDNELLKDMIFVTDYQISNDNLNIYIVDTIEELEESKMGNAIFQYMTNESSILPKIIIERKILRFLPDNKSLVMGILIHELSHAYMYFNNKEVFKSLSENILDKYLYEMDSLYIEALFYKECQKLEYKYKRFEYYITQSLENDNLGDASLFLYKVDNKLIWHMLSLNDEVISGDMTYPDLFKTVIELSQTLIQNWKENIEDNEKRYKNLISITTFDQYIAFTLGQILTDDSAKENIEAIEELNLIKSEMARITNENWPFTINFNNYMTTWIYEDI